MKFTVLKEKLFYQLKKMVRNKKYFLMKVVRSSTGSRSIRNERVYVQKDGSGKWHVQKNIAKRDIFFKRLDI
ncbi:hypothetical protein KHA80_21010 [Anaerobacillus sp. HL2]|nr:hypothetical protein KHA80_21010 [Anaerobacillus sp. HL2]